MKESIRLVALGFFAVAMGAGLSARAANPATYVVTVTNGSSMPLSGVVVYTQHGQISKSRVGVAPSAGLVQLCQTGNAMTRLQELGMSRDVTFKGQTSGMIMPGESRTIEVTVADPLQQSIQFEAMYVKTKDACAVAGIGSHSLYALQQHVTSNVSGNDDILLSGAFTDPVIPMGRTYLDGQVCAGAMDAISCVRSLSVPVAMGTAKIRAFAGYLSSIPMLLENRYGAADALTLQLPTAGAVRYDVQLKH